MLDTNVLISYLIFNSRTIDAVVEDVVSNHDLVIPTYVIGELREVVRRKWPRRSVFIE